jgi:UDP-glucuronate decarboxylase
VRLTGAKSRIVQRPLPVDDPPRRRPDISLAMSTLDWRPSTDLDSGLALTIEDVEQRLRRGDPSLLPLTAEHTSAHAGSPGLFAGGL